MQHNPIHIIPKTAIRLQTGDLPGAIHGIHFDSRKVDTGDIFVAISGHAFDGHLYIDQAIDKGATIIVLERMPANIRPDVCYVQVENTRLTLAHMASAYFDHPSKKLKLIGVTGTNGKTSIATLSYRLLSDMGYVCGLISTIENKIGDTTVQATHTTPDPLAINQLLYQMEAAGCQYCFMEVSSHALDQNRVDGLDFDGGIFTNLSHDHLDYHQDFASYLKAKKYFFDILKPTAFAISNIDDKNGMVMLQNCKAKTYTYALKKAADFKAKVMEMQWEGTLLRINEQEVWCRLTGLFNAYNMTAIYATAMLLEQNQTEVLQALSRLEAAAGRFQSIRSKEGKMAIVDYAHTPDALANVLTTISDIKNEGAHIITVVGAGGDRDKSKRPLMAQIATQYSWRVVLTSDNPRTESPEAILDDMMQGLSNAQQQNTLRISDRKEAIKTAAALAQSGDVILIAGKGHETYQDINGVKHHFDDTEVINEIFNIEK